MAKTVGEEKTKDQLFWQILDAALRLDCSKGHLRWKMTDLSRASGVTRSLIYYYFGNSKIAIMQAAVRIMGEEFFGLSDARQVLWQKGEVWESVKLTRQLVRNMPHIVVFYFTQRQPGAALYDEILHLEKRYLEKISSRFPKAKSEHLTAMFGAFFGLVTLTDLPDAALKVAVQTILGAVSGQLKPAGA